MAPVAPLSAHQLLVFLLQVGLLLGLALALGRLARRLGMPAIVGELFAGVLMGPSLLDHMAPGFAAWLLPHRPDQQHLLDAVGQVGVLLLVGVTGMHVDLDLIKRQRLTSIRVGTGGLLLPLAAGLGLGIVLPASLVPPGTDRTVFAWFMGVAMCVSAIPVIAKTLMEMRLLHRDIGQQIVTSAVVDDAIGWLLLSVVSAMATTGVHAAGLARSMLSLAGVVAFAVVLGRPIVRVVMRLVGRSEEAGVCVTAVVLVMFLCAAGTQALGMESVLGAFIGGVLISSAGWGAGSPQLTSLRTFVMAVLAPLYFATAGLRTDMTALARPAVAVAAAAVLLVAVTGKFAGAYAGARASRLGHWPALSLGAGLNARGVIGLVIATIGLRLGVLSTAMYTIVVLMAIVTSVMAPPILRYTVRRIKVTSEEQHREQVLFGADR
jgi:Kef-type K+ transport system membrane component KefB